MAVGAVVIGVMTGYLVSALFIFPPRNLAADLERVPDVVGRKAERARADIEARGLVYEEGAVFYHEAEKGMVIAQDPLAGQMAQTGSTVSVTVSLGQRMGSVPDVVGLANEQAELILEGSGYKSEPIYVDDEADVGQVVGTRPAPGTPVELSGEVKLLVSAGPSRVQVPEVTSRPLTEAREALERRGLRLGDVTEAAGGGAPGTVLEQRPAAGTEVARGTRITLVVTAGEDGGRRDSVPPGEASG